MTPRPNNPTVLFFEFEFKLTNVLWSSRAEKTGGIEVWKKRVLQRRGEKKSKRFEKKHHVPIVVNEAIAVLSSTQGGPRPTNFHCVLAEKAAFRFVRLAGFISSACYYSVFSFVLMPPREHDDDQGGREGGRKGGREGGREGGRMLKPALPSI
jgi:hypothetical protein